METIRIVCVGWQEDELTLGAVKCLRGGDRVVLRTGRCGCAEWLKEEGIPFGTLDELYEQCEDFDELIDASAREILDISENEPVIYCINDPSDKTIFPIIQAAKERTELLPGVSEGCRLISFAGDDVRIISAADADLFESDAHMSTLVRELDSPMLAGDIKLRLTEKYPDELEIFVCEPDGKIRSLPLCELDRLEKYDHRLCALVPAVRELERLERYDIRHLEEIMRRLRDFEGCPWDREQTHETLSPYMVEEAYEAVDAIIKDDTDALYDELGDLLFQIVFHAEIGRQYGEFELSDVTTAICRKMLRRHPHVFGDVRLDTVEDTRQLWSEIKKEERAQKRFTETLKDIAGSFPALMRSAKICKKVQRSGLSLPDLKEAWDSWQTSPNEETLGRLLMAMTGEAEKLGLESELALSEYLDCYIRRLEEAESD